jgi:hypothetical protein
MNEGVFVRPRWDDKTVEQRFQYLMDYAFWIGGEVVNYAHNQDFFIHELRVERGIREELEEFLDCYDPVFFFHFSHGGIDTLTGHDMTVLLCCNNFVENGDNFTPNHQLLRDRMVYTLSCLSASQLGPAAVADGCLAYIGYKDPLWLCTIEGSDTDYALFELLSGGAKQLIDGGSARESFYWLQRKYRFWIDYWEMIDATNSPNAWKAPTMLMVLEKNLKGLSLLGEPYTIIRDFEEV